MIKKVLALAVSLQLTMPLSLLAQSTQSQAPTANEVEIMLAKPAQAQKNYKNGILIGTGVGSFALYVAYTARKISRLNTENKELSKTLIELGSDIKNITARVAGLDDISRAGAADIAALDAKVSMQAKTLQTQGTKIGHNQAKLGQQSRVISGHTKTITRVVSTQQELVRTVGAHGEAIPELYSALENHAQAITGNSQGVSQIVESLQQVAPEKPRRPIGYHVDRETMPVTTKNQYNKLISEAQTTVIKFSDINPSAMQIGLRKNFKKIYNLLKRNCGKLGLLAGVAAVITLSLIPQETQAAGISNSRVQFTRALKEVKTHNPDMFAITALDLAEYNRSLVADIIAQSNNAEGFYPLLKSQIDDMTSAENMTLTESIVASGNDARYNKNNAVYQLQKSDFKNFSPSGFTGLKY